MCFELNDDFEKQKSKFWGFLIPSTFWHVIFSMINERALDLFITGGFLPGRDRGFEIRSCGGGVWSFGLDGMKICRGFVEEEISQGKKSS